jgi:hypothetical protein
LRRICHFENSFFVSRDPLTKKGPQNGTNSNKAKAGHARIFLSIV